MNPKLIKKFVSALILIELIKFSNADTENDAKDLNLDEYYDTLLRFKLNSYPYSMSRYYQQLKPYSTFERRNYIKPLDHPIHEPHHHYTPEHGIEKSEFYYILPILLVIGLGSFMIPIISTIFTAMITSNNGALGFGCCSKRRDQNFRSFQNDWQEKLLNLWSNVEQVFSTSKFKNKTALSNVTIENQHKSWF